MAGGVLYPCCISNVGLMAAAWKAEGSLLLRMTPTLAAVLSLTLSKADRCCSGCVQAAPALPHLGTDSIAPLL
ncbi:hypothetical protein CLOP_g19744 [Closterium sp. NIES-67]|nr:hypothetical protein CLOP_g19744 [Closterium sp. NIES-67]